MTDLLLIASAALGLGALAFTLLPLLRRRGAAAPRAAHEVEALKTALEDAERDLARGALTEAEAAGAKAEIARRLLAADAAAQEAADLDQAPNWARRAAIGVVLAVGAGAGALYYGIGDPAAADRPFAQRDLAAERAVFARQDAAEAAWRARRRPPPIEPETAALMQRLEEALEQTPDSLEGLRLLADNYERLGRLDKVWPARLRIAELEGAADAPKTRIEIARLMISAAGGYVSAEAAALLEQAAPEMPVAGYYLGFAAMQVGGLEGDRAASARWSAIYRADPDAPFAPMARSAALEIAARRRATVEAVLDRQGGAPGALLAGRLLSEALGATSTDDRSADVARAIRRYRALGRGAEAEAVAAWAARRLPRQAVGIRRINAARLLPWADAAYAPAYLDRLYGRGARG